VICFYKLTLVKRFVGLFSFAALAVMDYRSHLVSGKDEIVNQIQRSYDRHTYKVQQISEPHYVVQGPARKPDDLKLVTY
jgi:hypothetical protein